MKKQLLTKSVKIAGKVLTLMGFSLVFAACYAPAPYHPEYVIDDDSYYSTEEPVLTDEAAETDTPATAE